MILGQPPFQEACRVCKLEFKNVPVIDSVPLVLCDTVGYISYSFQTLLLSSSHSLLCPRGLI
ncbi:hypothetical protein CY34DRAFT_801479 [Suillus luteus UH-Slu-Lm8-n1]|uniref:Unplaced genomic scaffold CY34scaffold_40, whole genome shotgun sequence n=1 Tax=Suillus luteus UH-Slu-Lm8-n1 TaxID=930992 RepID=A0A0D0BHJ7_9AGAM|nr:hypothetical protein CY34DRAFT_801479 [Suillus luteus UH-Slu-Lm8-n1]